MSNKKMNDNKDVFFDVTEREIREVEQTLKLYFPEELKKFYLEKGYGFIKGKSDNINRIMDPYSVRDFRLRQNDFEFYPDINIYDEFEKDKLIFFEADESALISIELNNNNECRIYYYNMIIANSLDEFIHRIKKDDNYYLDLLD